jgi:rSAM/selenodomain-associated transferase 1
MPPAIIVFAKAPAAGRVKTRLIGRLTAEQGAALHVAFVSDTLENVANLGAVELHTDAPAEAAWREYSVPRALQVPGDLGVRMFHALRGALERGHPRAMIVGSDAPALPIGHLRALLESAADVALGPCEDGGYYAISCKRVNPRMFEGVEWSGPRTLIETVAAVSRCELSSATGESWWDVDEPGDLERLARQPDVPRNTAAALAKIRG